MLPLIHPLPTLFAWHARVAGIVTITFLALFSTIAQAQSLSSIEDMISDTTEMEGYFNLYWDDSAGKLYWEIDKLGTEFLYQISMGSGLGSNPIGIDRGQLRGTYLLKANRVGPKVLLEEQNYRYRATSDNALERQAVRDAFAPPVLWGFEIVAATGASVLFDATDFFLRDARNIVGQLAARNQGSYTLDQSRSAIFLDSNEIGRASCRERV